MIEFTVNSILLGVGLAMDAFSVSVANGLNNPLMRGKVRVKIAGTFAGFQCLMPVLGWMFVHFLVNIFSVFQKWIPWIALALLLYIGGKMIYEAVVDKDGEKEEEEFAGKELTNRLLIIQGIATSIDALSVGFTIVDYKAVMAIVCALIIAVVTFIICMIGLKLGIKVGMRLAKKASIFGGMILIFIGIEIFVKGVLM